MGFGPFSKFLRTLKNRRLPKVLKKGDIIYVPTELYVGHARDDFHGGRATIREIGRDEALSWDYIVAEENPGSCYGLSYLLENQEKWRKEFGKTKAHPVPDYSPEFNED